MKRNLFIPSRMIKFDEKLDVRGLNCPLPILRTKKMQSLMEPDEVLKVLTTDPAAEIDFRVFSEVSPLKCLLFHSFKKSLTFQ